MSRMLRHAVLAGVLLAGLSGCGGRGERAEENATGGNAAGDASGAKTGGTVIRRLESECKTLNYVLATTAYEQFVLRHLYDPIVDYDENGDLVPVLAASLPVVSADHLRVTIKLREDIHWQDGVPITSRDARFALARIQDPDVPALNKLAYFEKLARLETPDDHTLIFVWKEPFAPGMYAITQLWPIPEHIYGQGDFLTHPANRKPVGSGPFILDEWRSGQYISLKRYDDYHGRKAYLDRMIFKVVEDDAVALNMLKIGELDEMRVTQIQWEKQTVDADFEARFNRYQYYYPQYNFIGWNCRTPWFTDGRVRLAMTLLFDRESINNKIYSGYARLVSGPFYINSWAYDKTVRPHPYDPVRARQLLDEAGWIDSNGDGIRDKDGRKFEFELNIAHGSSIAPQFAQLLQEECDKSGVRVNIRSIEASTFFGKVDKGECDAWTLGWNLDLDPDVYDTFHSSKAPPNGVNYGGYRNSAVDSLLVAGRAEFDEEKRTAIYHWVHRIMHEDPPYTFVNAVPEKRPIARRIQGVLMSPKGPYDFWPGANYWWIDNDASRVASGQ
ncbi:MAG TPA: peptide-binding protein [Candidatus Krumholzibacteria bacterium]|nr:peptide-binding protein [Candidatus Krumholzibacteria bacterium]